ncbi:MAG: enoyl-CoA hydratase [Actinomycetota bacterium]|nr:enoyl-CoA hydratase [Actinomycetota bacterium]
MSDDVVLIERPEPGVAVLTLNRPDRLNAWTGVLGDRYFGLLDECAADPSVKVIVVTGAGKGFCAGADMNELQALGASKGGGGAAAAAGNRPQYTTTLIPKPVIAAINGACAGMGLAQALMCDMRFAAAGAKLTTSFSQRGLIAEWGLSWVLPRLVGTARAFDLLLSGRVVLVEEAAQMGLVNAVVPPEELLPYTIAYAAELAAKASPTSMAVMKRQVYADWDKGLIPAHDDAVELMKQSMRRPDFVEGVSSYLEKRPPAFTPVDPSA